MEEFELTVCLGLEAFFVIVLIAASALACSDF
jgi:hypothetical protein